MNNSAEIISAVEAKDIELGHTKFCHWIFHVKKSTNLSELYGEIASRKHAYIILTTLNPIFI